MGFKDANVPSFKGKFAYIKQHPKMHQAIFYFAYKRLKLHTNKNICPYVA